MIKGIFETHVEVRDLDRAMAFYESVLGLELGLLQEERRIAFYWVGGRGQGMLGLWEVADEDWHRHHFAFEVSAEHLANAAQMLAEHGVSSRNSRHTGDHPQVHTWMPAAALYFQDPDGNSLEFIAMVEGTPESVGNVVDWDEWQRRVESE
jgi:lactoylglutathione lyase